ncbi:PTS sugar transporter subunit IIC [uncultured Helcococcus sp.]|uniref:PTS sugar transporter subunit IIC n=1 Tax=uncultured Helcococcus sp. TaxID=1072508 RepID=UPI0026065DCF|nr:PTS sugar transporter subunit IIC [uncultured Helcococcus sp.]
MSKFNKTFEEKLLPIASKLGANKGLIAIRDGITLAMPLIIVGSIFMILASLPIKAFTDFLAENGISDYLWKGVNSSFGLTGLVASFGIANSMANQYKVDGIAAGIVSLSSFVVVTPFLTGEDGSGLTLSYLGSSGIFVAIVLGLLSAYVYQWFINKNIKITLPDSVPPAIARSFSAIIPGAVIITFWLIIFAVLDKYGLPNIHEVIKVVLGKPLGLLGSTMFGTMIVTGLNSLFWFMGIHGGSTVNSIFSPVWLANLDINAKAQQAGQPLTEIITKSFMDNFVYIGGGGATLGLVIVISIIALRKASSKQTKAMGPLTLVPGIFNINEPAVFGLPIVMNVALFIPFIIVPMINTLIAYFAFSSGLVPLTYASATWTMPPIISGFLTTGSLMGSLLQIVIITVDIMVYLPFYMMVEKANKLGELNEKID